MESQQGPGKVVAVGLPGLTMPEAVANHKTSPSPNRFI